MSDSGKKIRLRRVLGNPAKRALIVAFDHALVLGPIPGTEEPLNKIRAFAEADADSILVNLGLVRQLTSSPLDFHLPPIIARIDWTTVWSVMQSGGRGDMRSSLIARPEDALRQGADAVLTYMVVGTGDADFEAKEIARTADVARECERVGIPFIVESLARGKQVDNPGDPKWLNLHTRMAVELGADAVKTDYSGNVQTMRSVISGCPIPILVLGGSRQGSDQDALSVVRQVVDSGAAGVFFGRNVFQSENMQAFLRQARTILDTPSSS
jgi:DhnA family fructose-bisphosphate aldolase class Ia